MTNTSKITQEELYKLFPVGSMVNFMGEDLALVIEPDDPRYLKKFSYSGEYLESDWLRVMTISDGAVNGFRYNPKTSNIALVSLPSSGLECANCFQPIPFGVVDYLCEDCRWHLA